MTAARPDDGGQRLVRGWLFFALALSLLANIGHTLLADSSVPVWLRMIGAVAWPLLVFAGVDITVKVAWDLLAGKKPGIWTARLLILIPGFPALITSYEHMHAVLLAMAERPFIAMVGPGAVDLMMIGCTITLVLIQRTARLGQREAPATPVSVPPLITQLAPANFLQDLAEAHRDQDEHVKDGMAERTARSTRAPKADQEKAVRMMLDAGGDGAEAVAAGLMGASTMRRYVSLYRTLLANPVMMINHSERKVNPELAGIVHGWAIEQTEKSGAPA